MNFCVYGASSDQLEEKYLRAGFHLGECLAHRGHGIVFGGGNAGLMGAAARGVRSVGGAEIVGIVPSFFNVDGILYPHCTELIYTETMRERKHLMEERAAGFIITPGGASAPWMSSSRPSRCAAWGGTISPWPC
ncbi:MAG: LOG family protein [Lachnospiraceae bacterium]|nr:LOG family protein [Lachnospiraceae bacterium]